MSLWKMVFSAVSVWGLVGCGNQTEETTEKPIPSLSERLSESSGFKRDENGNWVPTNNKRSSFEHQGESAHFKGEIEKKTYRTGDYKKQSWWGKKSYEVEQYDGHTDGSRFQKMADLGNKDSRFGQQRYTTGDPYETNRLSYDPAMEVFAERMQKTRNDYTEVQRRKFIQPAVTDWKEQRKLSMEQSKSILGR
jgi:hypothetical protein